VHAARLGEERLGIELGIVIGTTARYVSEAAMR
jgi:hypothetical protein